MQGWMNHRGHARMFRREGLTVGLFFPIESYAGDMPTMGNQDELARRAEQLGFAALWVRDVPLRDPTFGDVGQIYDPWVFLGHVGAITSTIALATGAIVLPVRHPLHEAKAAASVDRLTGGRLVLGVASGDRPRELAAFGVEAEDRGRRVRQGICILRRAWRETFPPIAWSEGVVAGLDTIPKPQLGRVPVLVTGRAQQSLGWIAEHADGWVTYPRPLEEQARVVRLWRAALEEAGRDAPIAQSLYVDLEEDASAPPRPIHLGWKLGRHALMDLLGDLERMGMGHVVLNLKYGSRPAAEVVEELGAEVLPRLGVARGRSVA